MQIMRKSANKFSQLITFTDFIGLIFFLFVLVEANIDANFSDSNREYTIGLYFSLAVICIHLANVYAWEKDVIDFCFEIASFLWVIILLIYLLPPTTIFAQASSPVFVLILFEK